MGQNLPAVELQLGTQLIFKDLFGVDVGNRRHGSIQKASQELRKKGCVFLTLVAQRLLGNGLPKRNGRA